MCFLVAVKGDWQKIQNIFNIKRNQSNYAPGGFQAFRTRIWTHRFLNFRKNRCKRHALNPKEAVFDWFLLMLKFLTTRHYRPKKAYILFQKHVHRTWNSLHLFSDVLETSRSDWDQNQKTVRRNLGRVEIWVILRNQNTIKCWFKLMIKSKIE